MLEAPPPFYGKATAAVRRRTHHLVLIKYNHCASWDKDLLGVSPTVVLITQQAFIKYFCYLSPEMYMLCSANNTGLSLGSAPASPVLSSAVPPPGTAAAG
mmetsp:Transcript_19584/g.34383  ORF Transcript_19584/g.34383 Transcript_19584/m.34383 type:complete len:100 (+) Transcript_19584:30-329(+)